MSRRHAAKTAGKKERPRREQRPWDALRSLFEKKTAKGLYMRPAPACQALFAVSGGFGRIYPWLCPGRLSLFQES